jgi:hypothetical protein
LSPCDLADRAFDQARFLFGRSFDNPEGILYQARMRIFTSVSRILLVWISAVSLVVAADAPSKFTVSEFVFTRPADWQWIEVNSVMRKAQLKIVDADKKDSAEVIFFYFGEGGGGVTKDNIDRWLSQFQEPKEKLNSKVEEVTISQRKVTYVQAEGTYLSGMPGGPKTPQPNTMLLGAIIESDQGNVFIRLTGPIKLAKASQPALRKMVEGALGSR